MARPDIAFLHTSPVHIATFDALMQAQAPQLRVAHSVDEGLLADAHRLGADEPGVVARVQQAMHEAALAGAKVAVCTCSTIGAAAERTVTHGAFMAHRIDRAMADEAALRGPRILLVAALASTLSPTQALVQDSAQRLQRPVAISLLALPEAWPFFESGDMLGYLHTIATATSAALANHDVVVLAQASMAPAAALLAEAGVPVLSSPRLGAAAAIKAFHGFAMPAG